MKNNDISLNLVELMDTSHLAEFEKLLSEFNTNPQIREATTTGLLKMMHQGYNQASIRAVKLIGALKISQAEGQLLNILKSQFPASKLQTLATSVEQHLPEHQFLTSLLAALMLIGSEEGTRMSNIIKEQFRACWIGSYLDAVHEKVAH